MKSDPLEKVCPAKEEKEAAVFVEEGAMDELLDNYSFGDGAGYKEQDNNRDAVSDGDKEG